MKTQNFGQLDNAKWTEKGDNCLKNQNTSKSDYLNLNDIFKLHILEDAYPKITVKASPLIPL